MCITDKMDNAEIILNAIMDFGCELMTCNASIGRTERMITEMGIASGAYEMNVFVITSSIIVTMILSDGKRLTQTRRINEPSGFNFGKLIELHKLGRGYCNNPCQVDLQIQLNEIKERLNSKEQSSILNKYAGSMIAGGVFSILYGGTVIDGMFGMMCGVFTCFIGNISKRFAPNQLILQLLSSYLTGTIILLIGKMIPVLHTDKIMIGVIMLLIPGTAMTNSIKDLFIGDTMAGSLRFIETIVWAGALAMGFLTSMVVIS